jgi:hypothetical protein
MFALWGNREWQPSLRHLSSCPNIILKFCSHNNPKRNLNHFVLIGYIDSESNTRPEEC